ncbi:hypothetical protein KRR38_03475 [Novosphingobium sp. G106]|uniref:hypothetical protein n=1 Tax=Novosphingobium sp. G106 TaxID=2849500 RepID=UPI001C2DAA05|nr:hypothetical protein [Novosphingobium sp. G106]MBV1686756.1 hypothetical protein [Novosphingobium sp. G106]
MMKQIIAAGLAAATMLAAPAYARVNARQHHQQDRIGQGVRSGELTRREARGLEQQQMRIARSEARMRASGGGLSPAERSRLAYRQDRASVNIYQQKHDGQVR